MSDIILKIKKELREKANKDKIETYKNFFKTGKGEYGEGDIFLGVNVPNQRIIAKKYFEEIPLIDIEELLSSAVHEERLTALLILVYKYKNNKKEVFYFYLKNIKYVNNWDLVDSSANQIVGDYLFDKDKDVIYEFANSENIWIRRIAIVSTFYFIKKGKFDDTLRISEILLNDEHDLIHKATGWMLREVGKKEFSVLCGFLDKYYKKMPRTMLRYAIERLNADKKKFYMQK